MKQYERLTKYIFDLKNDRNGDMVQAKKEGNTLIMPHVEFTETVNAFTDEVYRFVEETSIFGRESYGEILEKNGLEWSFGSMQEAIMDQLDGQCIVALIIVAIRAERFCDGAFLRFLDNGSIVKWLERLQELDK